MPELNATHYFIFRVFGYVYIVIILLGVMTNTLIILTVLLTKYLRKRLANWFVISLTVSGLLFSCLIIPCYSYTLTTGSAMSDIACKFVTFGDWFLSGAAVLNLTAMALNRYFVIIWTKKTKLTSVQCVLIMICLCYIVPAVLVLPGLTGTAAEAGFDIASSRCTLIEKTSKQFKMLMIMILAAGPILIIIYCYCHILYEVRKSRKRLVDINQAQKSEASRMRHEIKLTVTIGLIFVAYLVTYVPTMVVNGFAKLEPWEVGRQFTILLVYCFVWTNPLVYGLQHKQFRDAFSGFWAGKCHVNVNAVDTQASNTELQRDTTNEHHI